MSFWNDDPMIEFDHFKIYFLRFCSQFYLDVLLKWAFKLDLIISKGQINKSTIIFVIVQKVFPSWKKIMEKFRLQQKARFYSFQRDRGPSTVHVIITYIANQIFRQTHLHLWLKVWSKSMMRNVWSNIIYFLSPIEMWTFLSCFPIILLLIS